MAQSCFVRWTMVCAMVVGSVVAVKTADAFDGTTPAGQQHEPSQVKILDVELAEGGVLKGQLVNHQGNPPPPQEVTISDGWQVITTATTKKDGTFVAEGLRGGNYVIEANDGRTPVRLWTAGTAPPSASEGALLVTQGHTVRGNGLGGITSGVLRTAEAKAICAGVAILVGAAIIQHHRQDNDAS